MKVNVPRAIFCVNPAFLIGIVHVRSAGAFICTTSLGRERLRLYPWDSPLPIAALILNGCERIIRDNEQRCFCGDCEQMLQNRIGMTVRVFRYQNHFSLRYGNDFAGLF
jgi:hypothetical protein